jgi:hypothetical protein
MMSQELVPKKNTDASGIDYECPYCRSPLAVYYDGDMARHICENCDCEQSLFDIDRDDGDNNISGGFDDESNRGLF